MKDAAQTAALIGAVNQQSKRRPAIQVGHCSDDNYSPEGRLHKIQLQLTGYLRIFQPPVALGMIRVHSKLVTGNRQIKTTPMMNENGDVSWWTADVVANDSGKTPLSGGDIRPTTILEQVWETHMDAYKPVMSFGDDVAESYDKFSIRGDEDATVAFLTQLARGGPALELAIGTGRIALPLAAQGIPVDGIDFSPAMIARLRARPGGAQLAVTLGNFADVPVPGVYRLIYIVFNTLFNLLSQDEQVRCFQNVAARLSEDGVFVIEGGMPTEFCNLRRNQYVDLEGLAVGKVRLDVAQYDPVTQLLEETHITLSSGGIQLNPIVTRYIWPSELDLMARIAGLRLRERWASWGREPLTAASGNCISVYERIRP